MSTTRLRYKVLRAALIVAALLALGGEARAQCTGQPPGNQVCASPNGAAGLPGFRALVTGDLPSLPPAGITVGTTTITSGTSGRIPYNNAGVYGEFVVGGDCTFSAPNFTCTKTGGANFATVATSGAYNDLSGKPALVASATIDTTNAANITSGTLAASRGGAGTISGALKGNGSGLVSQAACADLSNGATGCSTTVGTVATANIGTSGATVPLLNGNNTFSGTNNFTGGLSSSGTAVSTTVGSGTAALATAAIASAACASAITVAASGVATTDAIIVSFNGDPTAVTGYVPLTTGMLTIIPYPTTNNVNFKVCNNTGASITPGAITLNWRVVR